ncbi:MAG TPA: urease accessory protein UreD [Streptosporangiaceae bacterium]
MTRGYTAHAAVVAEPDGTGGTRITRLRSDGPLALRATRGGHPATVYLVGAAAGPLGGDDLTLHLTVAPGARLAVRSAATTLVLPGDGESRFTVLAGVGAGGWLDFAPEPVVAVAGCHHGSFADIELAAGAALRWRDELVLGRHRERPGRYAARCDVTLGGAGGRRPLLRHELRLDGAGTYASRAVLGGARAAGAVVLAGPGLTAHPYAGAELAVLPLAGPGVLVSATAADAAALRRLLDHGTELAGGPGGGDAGRGEPARNHPPGYGIGRLAASGPTAHAAS